MTEDSSCGFCVSKCRHDLILLFDSSSFTSINDSPIAVGYIETLIKGLYSLISRQTLPIQPTDVIFLNLIKILS